MTVLTEADMDVLVQRFGHDPACLSSIRLFPYEQIAPGHQGPACQVDVLDAWTEDMVRFFGCQALDTTP